MLRLKRYDSKAYHFRVKRRGGDSQHEALCQREERQEYVVERKDASYCSAACHHDVRHDQGGQRDPEVLRVSVKVVLGRLVVQEQGDDAGREEELDHQDAVHFPGIKGLFCGFTSHDGTMKFSCDITVSREQLNIHNYGTESI